MLQYSTKLEFWAHKQNFKSQKIDLGLDQFLVGGGL